MNKRSKTRLDLACCGAGPRFLTVVLALWPNVGKLFIDFVLSRQGARLYPKV